jgi:short-subunit dehydrogenase
MKTATTETVLITGASSGIGLELAKCFAADKSDLILVARNTEALEKIAEELRREYKIKVHVLTADLSLSETPEQIFTELKGRGLTVDILVNNAGFGLHGEFDELPLARQLEMIQVNVASLVALTGQFLPGMIKRQRGGILNVGSVAGFIPGPHMAVYYATKAFVMSFSEALHEELRSTRITVTDLCPGPTETNFSQVARSHRTRKSQAGKMSAQAVARMGYQNFRQDRCFSMPGWSNKLLAIAPKFLPRAIIRRLVGKYNDLK